MTESNATAAEERAELRALIQEAHGTIKDLRRELKEAKAAIADEIRDAARDIGVLARDIAEQTIQHHQDWIMRVTEKCPISMLCPGCGELLALVTADGEPCVCGKCGKRFAVRSALPEDGERA